MMRLTAIQTFITIVETGNFSKAANRLDISAMAVSKQINQLEQSLGVNLFERSTRKMQLTETGKILFEQFKEILLSLENVTQFITSTQTTPTGTLRVVSTISIGETFLIPHLSKFLAMYPNINMQLKLIDLMPDFSQEKVDVALGFSLDVIGTQIDDLRHVPLLSFTRKVYASKVYLEKHGHPKTLEECNGHHYIEHYYRTNDEFLHRCKKNKIKLRNVISSNSTAAIIDCCLDGLGLASLADFIVNQMPVERRLIELENLIPYNPIDTYIFYRNLRFIDPKILCFKEFFKKKLL